MTSHSPTPLSQEDRLLYTSRLERERDRLKAECEALRAAFKEIEALDRVENAELAAGLVAWSIPSSENIDIRYDSLKLARKILDSTR